VKGIYVKKDGVFPLRLTGQHCLMLHQTYPWLQQIGATDDETDAALEQIPSVTITGDDIAGALEIGVSAQVGEDIGFIRSRKYWIKAKHLPGMIKLLRLTGAYNLQGEAGLTIRRRAEEVAFFCSQNILDVLADARR
jgi:hypothetical protein